MSTKRRSRLLQSRPTALVACEASGIWSQYLVEAGFDVTQVDIALPAGRRDVYGNWTQIGGDVTPYLAHNWDVVACFPPCTDISYAGAHLFKRKGDQIWAGLTFFLACCECAARARVAGLVENPRGLPCRLDVGTTSIIVHPWQFAESQSENVLKLTHLWLYRWSIPFPTFAGSTNAKPFVDTVPGGKNQKTIRSASWRGMAKHFVSQVGGCHPVLGVQ